MPAPGHPPAFSPDRLARVQRSVAAALWHYTTAPVAKPYYVRGCVPEPGGARVIVALWTGPAARDKRNLFLSVPLVHDGLPVSAAQVTMGLLRLGRGTHVFGFSGRWFDGKPVLNGRALVDGGSVPPPHRDTGDEQGPRGFYFERPGRLKTY